MKYLLLLVVVLFLGMPGAMAFTAVTGSLDTSYGNIDYSITGDGAQTQAATVDQSQSASNAHIFVKGFSMAGSDGDDFDAWIEANTDAGDYAFSELYCYPTGSSITSVTNLNLYGFITPNLAWTGLYVDEVKGSGMDFYQESYTNDEGEPYHVDEVKGSGMDFYQESYTNDEGEPYQAYQASSLDWLSGQVRPRYADVDSGTSSDYYAKQVWMTSQAGGSADPSQFPVGQTNGWGGEGTYAMSNMEYGTFGISGANQADDYWALYQYAESYDPDGNDLYADVYYQYFYDGKLSFTVNTPAMNYADADVAYSNTDFAVTGAGLTYMDDDTSADSENYPPDTSRHYEDDKEVDYVPLSTIDNVFTYSLARATPTRNVVSNIVFY